MLDKEIIDLLQNRAGYKFVSSSDCESLSADIERSTGEKLGATTLKRLLGFTSETASPRLTTLNILSKYLGFESYDFLKNAIDNRGDSDFDPTTSSINTRSMDKNAEIILSYAPNRQLTLRHILEDKFEVTQSINGSLREGDIIYVDNFTDGLPMIAKDVTREGESLGRYIAGGQFGISIEEI